MPTLDEKLASGRVACSIPGCTRTFKDEGFAETICGKHWRLAPVKWRRQVSLLRKRYRALCGDSGYWDFPPGSRQRMEGYRIDRLFHRAWDRCKRRVVERAMGL